MVQSKLRFALASMLVCLMMAGGGVARAATALSPPQYAFDCGGWPIIISQPGSYVLTANLVLPCGSKDAIDITADNVTLDLGGYSIIGTGAGTGIGVSAGTHSNITVKNGSVSKMGGGGLISGDNATVTNIGFYNNLTAGGVSVGKNSLLKDNIAASNTNVGIKTGDVSTIAENMVSGTTGSSFGDGINAGNNCIVRNNTSNGNNGAGIDIGKAGTVVGNTASGNTSDGIVALSGSFVANNTATGNSGTAGIQTTQQCNLIGNTATSNHTSYGILVNVNSALTSNNASLNDGGGIFVNSCPANLVGNTAVNNTGANYTLGGSGCTQYNDL